MSRVVAHKRTKPQAGQVTVLVALAMVVILGLAALVVDGGLLYVTRQRLQDVADMAALAAGTAMAENGWQTSHVIDVIDRTVAANFPGAAVVTSMAGGQCQSGSNDEESENDQEGDDVGNHSYTLDVLVCASDTKVTVTLTRPDVGFAFAELLGQAKATVSATATAEAGVPQSVSGHQVLIMPWGVYLSSNWRPEPGEEDLLFGCDPDYKGNEPCDGTGNFGALVLGANGADQYNQNVANGYGGSLSVNQPVQLKPGAMAGPTNDGVQTLLSKHSGDSNECRDAGVSGVFVVVPVIEKGDGNHDATVAGFAGYCISRSTVTYLGANGRVTIFGTFVSAVIPGDLTQQHNSDDDNDNWTDYYGLRVVHLVPNPQ